MWLPSSGTCGFQLGADVASRWPHNITATCKFTWSSETLAAWCQNGRLPYGFTISLPAVIMCENPYNHMTNIIFLEAAGILGVYLMKPPFQLNAHWYPTWASLAHDYLSVMASSVSSERAFSSAGITITKHRNRLKGDVVEALQCMKCIHHNELLF